MADTTSFTLRLPTKKYNEYQKEAKKQGISLNAYIINKLSQPDSVPTIMPAPTYQQTEIMGRLIQGSAFTDNLVEVAGSFYHYQVVDNELEVAEHDRLVIIGIDGNKLFLEKLGK